MIQPEDSGEMELVPLPSGRAVQRWKAYKNSEPIPLVCATLPIIGTTKVAELLRSNKKRVLRNQWTYFMTEHQKHTDKLPLDALRRGLHEELGYELTEHKDPLQKIQISYVHAGKQPLKWIAHLYVVPIRSLDELTPDGKEIVEVRARPLTTIINESLRSGSRYHRFKPASFLGTLNYHTQKVIESYLV